MGLIIHLPLTKDLKNFGSSSIREFKSSSSLNYEDGKIGKCLSVYKGETDGIFVPELKDCSVFTVSAWVNIDNTESSQCSYNKIIRLFMDVDGSQLSFRLEHKNSMYETQVIFPKNTTCGGSNTNNYIGSDFSLSSGWNHLVAICDGSVIKFYRNGVLVWSTNCSNVMKSIYRLNGWMCIGESGAIFKMNDLRVYDEALSLKEIKELSNGLVLNYPLNNPYEEPTKNLITNFDKGTTVTKTVYKDFQRVTFASSDSYVNMSHNFGLHAFASNTSAKGKTFSASCLVKTSKDMNMSIQVQRNQGNYQGKNSEPILCKCDTWTRLNVVFTFDSSDDLSFYARVYPNNKEEFVDGCYFDVKEYQIEEKDHMTPYCKDNRNIKISDGSGFRNHGATSLDVCPKIDLDNSAIGDCSFDFDKKGECIWCSDFPNIIDEITVSAWVYYKERASTDKPIVTKSNSESYADGFGLWDGYAYDMRWTVCGSELRFDITDLYGKWVHLVGTYNSTTGKSSLYRDGVKIAEKQLVAGTKIQSNNAPLRVGKSTRGGASMSGNISDVRIYCTCLSDEDILSLYNNKMSVNKNGKVFAKQVIEDSCISDSIDVKLTVGGYPNQSCVKVNDYVYWGSRSWNLFVMNSKFEVISNTIYDVFSSVNKANEMISAIDLVEEGSFCIVYTNDSPYQNSSGILEYLKKYTSSIKSYDWGGRDAYYLVFRKGEYKAIAERFMKRSSSSEGITTKEVTITLKKNRNSITKKAQFVSDELNELNGFKINKDGNSSSTEYIEC